MLFVILFTTSCEKIKHPSFLIDFGKQIEDKGWLRVGLSKCDRQTVVTSGVNVSWSSRSICDRRVIV